MVGSNFQQFLFHLWDVPGPCISLNVVKKLQQWMYVFSNSCFSWCSDDNRPWN